MEAEWRRHRRHSYRSGRVVGGQRRSGFAQIKTECKRTFSRLFCGTSCKHGKQRGFGKLFRRSPASQRLTARASVSRPRLRRGIHANKTCQYPVRLLHQSQVSIRLSVTSTCRQHPARTEEEDVRHSCNCLHYYFIFVYSLCVSLRM